MNYLFLLLKRGIFLFGILIGGCKTKDPSTQISRMSYVETIDTKNNRNQPMLIGKIELSNLQYNSNYKWFDANIDTTKVDTTVLQLLKKNIENYELLVFAGTWCGDTKALLPQLYSYVFKGKIPTKKITLIAVDRNKKSLNGIARKFRITRVPTFIVMNQQRQEIGRVEEYGQTGEIMKEIIEIMEKNDP